MVMTHGLDTTLLYKFLTLTRKRRSWTMGDGSLGVTLGRATNNFT
jgi:hypothetical protein